MQGRGCLSLVIVFGFLISLFLLPILYMKLIHKILTDYLHLSPFWALLAIIGIFLGTFFNIPLWRIPRQEEQVVEPLRFFFVDRILNGPPASDSWQSWGYWRLRMPATIVAVNVGGCVIPCLICLYELFWLLSSNLGNLIPVLFNLAFVSGICYRLARPVPQLGITVPALAAPIAAALPAIWLTPVLADAPAVAYLGGTFGVLLGADLLHLRQITRTSVGLASIGGAGTFDGIVLAGLSAVLVTLPITLAALPPNG